MKKPILFSLACIVLFLVLMVGFNQKSMSIKSKAYETRFHYAEQLYSYAMFYYGLSELLSENNQENLRYFIKGNKIGLEKRAIYEDVSEIVFNDLEQYYNDETNQKIKLIITQLRSTTFDLYDYFGDRYEEKKTGTSMMNELNKMYSMIYPTANNDLAKLNLYNLIVHPDEVIKNHSKEQIDEYLNNIDLTLKGFGK
ncbi:hypothetical protein [Brevibacillus borstelensis]|uniref:hypothetical protein n=1 Tax=Brevibacillus borstelensis TaxID=45462 RepID=UPI0030C43DE6